MAVDERFASSANGADGGDGGLPSYAAATDPIAPPPAEPGAAASSSTSAAGAESTGDNGGQGSKDSKSFMFSLTQAALEMPLLTATQRIPPPRAQTSPLPPFLLHCTLFASYDANDPSPIPFQQVGCPATHARGEPSATSKSKVSQSVTRLRKRLGVQIPLAYLGSPGFGPAKTDARSPIGGAYTFLAHPQPRDGAEMTARSGNISRYRKVSLFQAQARELTQIVSRPLVERVVSAIFAGQGIYNRMALFPIQAVLRYTSASATGPGEEERSGWMAKLKAKAKTKTKSDAGPSRPETGPGVVERTASGSGAVRSVRTPVVFATLDLLAPLPRLMETRGPYPVEMNKASEADLATSARLLSEFDRATDAERFARFMFAPTQADGELMEQMLAALERRGAIWCEAGRLITPSSRNPNPRERARFLVKGVFPDRFAARCKHYRTRKFEPMPSDLAPSEVRRFGAPLIVHRVVERTGAEGIDLSDYLSNDPTNPREQVDWEWDEHDNLVETSATTETLPDYTSAQKERLDGFGLESDRANALIEAEDDFFTGWSIGVTEEPFKNGGWMESLGTGSALWFAGGAVC